MLAPRGNEVAEERDPVAVVLVEAVPEGPQPRTTREVREQRRLAVAGFGHDEHDAVVDLDLEPVEKPGARQSLFAQLRALHLRRLDRISVQVRAVTPRHHRRRYERRSAWTYRDGVPRRSGALPRSRRGPRERYGGLAGSVNGRAVGQGHAGHGARTHSSTA